MCRFYWCFSLALIVFINSFAHAEVGEGLLWRVHKPKHPANYLFGTIHVDDKRVKKLNPEIRRRFEESRTVCLEVLPDRETQVGIGLAMLLSGGQTLDELVGEPLFNRLSLALNKKGMTPVESVYLKPWAAMIVLSRPESAGGLALDEQLYHWAQHEYKQLCALETLQEQLSIFDELALPDQIILLKDTLDNLEQLQAHNEQLILAYLSGDLDDLYRISMALEGEDDELSAHLREKLIDQRNVRMAQRMEPFLKKGKAFIAVGALHLPGKNGLLQLLREKGFVVTSPKVPVSPW